MRKIIQIQVILCCISVSCPLQAQNRTIEDVKDEVCTFFASDTVISSREVYKASYRDCIQVTNIKRGNTTYLYAVNMPDSGWAIVSNEQRYPTIIGYSTDSHFDTNLDNQPGALKLLLEHHMNMIDSLRESPSTFYKRVSSPSPISHSIENLHRTTDSILLKRNGMFNNWRQQYNNDYFSYDCDKVYNKFCPDFFNVSCGRTCVGCTAVAIAQILWYWKWPDYAMINDTIDAAGVLYGAEHRHYYDWNNMPTSIYNTTPMYQVNMVAGLLRDCGYAANIIYSLAGSAAGTIKLNNALENTFHFHVNNMFEYAWINIGPILQAELLSKRPVICQATNSSVEIHTFVIDGYSATTNKYHINWGWGATDYGMWDLGFNGYTSTRTFFTELYPDCTAREASVSSLDINTITSGNDVTLYSANNISLSQLMVANGGHLNVSVGNIITLSNGFVAQQGSFAHLAPNYHCSSGVAPICMPKYRDVDMENTIEIIKLYITPNPANREITIHSEIPIKIVTLFGINGQQILQTDQMPIDISHLPKGIYIIRAITEDEHILQSKVIHD